MSEEVSAHSFCHGLTHTFVFRVEHFKTSSQGKFSSQSLLFRHLFSAQTWWVSWNPEWHLSPVWWQFGLGFFRLLVNNFRNILEFLKSITLNVLWIFPKFCFANIYCCTKLCYISSVYLLIPRLDSLCLEEPRKNYSARQRQIDCGWLSKFCYFFLNSFYFCFLIKKKWCRLTSFDLWLFWWHQKHFKSQLVEIQRKGHLIRALNITTITSSIDSITPWFSWEK